MRERREHSLNDLELINNIRSGDRESFELMVRNFQGMVYSVCLKFVGQSGPAEDLAQEVFIKAYRSLDTFRGESSLSTWLYQVAMRKCLDWKRSTERERSRLTVTPIEEHTVPELSTPEREYIKKERHETVLKVVRDLREPYRSVVQLYYFDECSYEQIAHQTGLPIKTIESQLYRARKLLREKGGVLG